MKKFFGVLLLKGVFALFSLQAHCQMPCGIYHDNMVFDQVDQYIETMIKGITVIKDNHSSTPQERNECIRWVVLKEKLSSETADLLMTYFLQQKIKPGEAKTPEILVSIHKLLFILVQIKQQVNVEPVKAFFDEWEKFKLFFHVEGYECLIDNKEIKEHQEKQKAVQTTK